MSTLPPSSFPGNGGDPNPIHHHTGVGDVNEIHGVYDVDKADPDEEPSPTTRGQWKDGLPGDVNVTLNEAQKRAFAALVAEYGNVLRNILQETCREKRTDVTLKDLLMLFFHKDQELVQMLMKALDNTYAHVLRLISTNVRRGSNRSLPCALGFTCVICRRLTVVPRKCALCAFRVRVCTIGIGN